jgi:Tol biopolymer transport system component
MKAKTRAIIFLSVFLLCLYGLGESLSCLRMHEMTKFPIEGKIVFHSNSEGDNEIYLITKSGIKKLTDNSWDDEYPVWSPDGKKIAYTSNREGNYDIFLMNADGSGITRLTSSPTNESYPAWFPDGRNIAFEIDIKKFTRTESKLYRLSLDTKKSKGIIPRHKKRHGIPNLSPTGHLLTFTAKRMMGWDVAVYDFRTKQLKFLAEGGKSCRARFSKDGKKLAYVSTKEDRKGEIWIMNPDGTEKLRLTDRDETHDYFPSWSPDNKYVVFNSSHQHKINGDWKLCIIEVETRKVKILYDSPGSDVFPDWHQ